MSNVIRNTRGQFIAGHASASPGRPRRETELEFHTALVGAVSLDDWIAIISTAVEKAKRGDRFSREFLASYLIGKPTETVDLHTDQQRHVILLLPGQQPPQIDGEPALESVDI